jgi:hypothetical protein
MPDEDRRPWDARLVDWMSRDSQKARSSRKTTPKQRGALLTLYAVLGILNTTTGDRHWIYWGGFIAILALIALALSLWERRHRSRR